MIVSTQNNTMVNISDKDLSNTEIFNYIKKINLNHDINFFYLGKQSYVDAWELQKQLH